MMLNDLSWALSFLNNLLKTLYFTNLVVFIFNSAQLKSSQGFFSFPGTSLHFVITFISAGNSSLET